MDKLIINNKDLTKKLNYILKELEMNKKEFLEECQKYNPSMSKPTVINMFKGNNTTTPTLMTLQTVIKVCQNSNNENLKRVSFNYLLNDGIEEIEAKNNQLFEELGLNDGVIATLKRFNTDFIPLNRINIINYYLYHTPFKYWQYLELLKKTYELKKSINDKNEKNIEKILDDENLNSYLQQYFNNVYELLKSDKYNLKNINELLDIVIEHFKIKLIDLDKKMLDNMEENI